MHENYLKIIQAKTLAFRSGLTFGSAMILIVEIPLVVTRRVAAAQNIGKIPRQSIGNGVGLLGPVRST